MMYLNKGNKVMAVMQKNGTDFYYEESGKRGMPTVIFSNSLGANLGMWDRQVDALKDSYHILRYDQRGHGKTSVSPNTFDFNALGNDVTDLMDELGIERAHCVGLSMGGMTALGLGINHGHRFISLTASNCVATFSNEARGVWKDRISMVSAEGLEPILDATMERWFTGKFISNNSAEIAEVRNMVASTPISGYIGCCRALERLDYFSELPSIAVPVLLIGGEHDLGTPPSEMRKMKELIPNSRYEELATAHVGNIEAYEEYNELLLTFLSSIDA